MSDLEPFEVAGGASLSIATAGEEYPALTREDVLARIKISAELMSHHFSLRRVA